MNIQRYKWPVIVAAGLHGALFLSLPDSSLVPIQAHTKDDPLPPMRTETVMEVVLPPSETDSETTPARGGAAVRELPELISALPEKALFTKPAIDRPTADTSKKSLVDFNGLPPGAEIGPFQSTGPQFIESIKLDRQPRATAQMSPDYPSTMRQQGIAGSVTVEFYVDVEGRVIRAEAVRSTRREFAEPALRAVRNWHFEPGKRNGRPVPFRMAVPIEFNLGAD
jgi:protein TonB